MDELKPWNPTMRQSTQMFMQELLQRMGMSPYGANRGAYGFAGGGTHNMGMGLLDFTPVGLAFGLQEGSQAIRRGMDIGGPEGAVEGGLGLLEVGLNAIPAAAATRPLVKKGKSFVQRKLGK